MISELVEIVLLDTDELNDLRQEKTQSRPFVGCNILVLRLAIKVVIIYRA